MVIICLIPVNLICAQDEYMLQQISGELNKNDVKQIEKAEKYLALANEQMNEAKTLEGSGKSKNKALNKHKRKQKHEA